MKLATLLFAFLLSATIATASLYGYPKEKKPAVPLVEACEIASAMLKSRGEDSQYHAFRTSLYGDKEQSGDGAWTIYFSDEKGNEVWVHIPLKKGTCSLTYYAHDYSTKGGEPREIEFKREGTKVTVSDKEPNKDK